ncbi:hypothetical protein HNQ51_000270 [Inhella inkyongensis]|uniref:DUF3348 family protein n=1 Tax=Inhella inkyongensis TaxID=392593 RepID=A0A840RWB6_9BURK|nr:DUF3348 family protein [Inhella inkyongensis]MBB5202977.1 hypothetical protein [Inhella inkyongensis]
MGQSRVRPPGGLAPGASALQGLLARWGLKPGAASAMGIAERLAAWMDWRDAIALAQALQPGAAQPTLLRWDGAAALERLQRELHLSFADRALVHDAADPASYRLHHANQQRLMAARIAPLRERLRQQLQGFGPQAAQLAALDAVFEQAFAAREQQALAALPSMLARRAALLRAQEIDWQTPLWTELQQALNAELELRLQALWGLLEALQAHSKDAP